MISVVIPLYNKEPHIAKTLESVLAQTCPASDIVVVDDGSKDQGAAVVARYADRGVRLIQQANQGESAARNTGIAVANTPYIAFLDADDWWLPEHLDELTRLIQAHPQADVLSTSHLIWRDGQMYRAKTSLPPEWRGELPDFFEQYAQGLSIINSSTACVRRSAVLAVGGFPVGIKRGPDVMTWINLALQGRAAHANVTTAVYNQAAVNRTNTLREQEPPGSLQHLASLISDPKVSPQQKTRLRRLYSQIAFFTAAGFCLEGDKSGAKKIMAMAWGLSHGRLALAIGFMLIVPSSLLLFAKQRRHVRQSDGDSR